ncbi:MAG TPA: ADP-forming succinate--CoA ligase subunit beta [Candidatus Thermoplasmatota archaeon]|nr:ADP-forming succinate--CoA ligase subunit beta [Candidatus Thermoplasmatota archaeon]
MEGGVHLNLLEYRGKEIFARYGLRVPKGKVVTSPEELEGAPFPAVLKVQIGTGGRGKAGGVKFANSLEEAKPLIPQLMALTIKGYKVRKVLVAEKLEIAQEVYVGIVLDRLNRCPVILATAMGGMEVEDVPPDKMFKAPIDPLVGLRPYHLREMSAFLAFPKDIAVQIEGIVETLWKIYRELDCTLIEVNPTAITPKGEVYCADAKVVIDNDALFRHAEFTHEPEDIPPLEAKAKEEGIAFVQLDGDIGVIANGAGLTMATLDMLSRFGGRPAIFLDLGGTDDPEKVKACFRLMDEAKPSKIFLNIFGGITKCDTVAQGVTKVIEEENIKIPLVARIKGRNEDAAREILAKAGIEAETSFEKAAEKVVALKGV